MRTALKLRHAPPTRLRRQGGIALVTALVLLIVLTALGLSSLKRGVTEERSSRANRRFVAAETAALTALRWCEAEILRNPRAQVTVPATNAGDIPAWTVPGNWAPGKALAFTGTEALLPGYTLACLIEDARDDLVAPLTYGGGSMETNANNTGAEISARMIKYRITVRVQTSALLDASPPLYLQSELRFVF
jgi:Tfp pilus assembly protein PilX